MKYVERYYSLRADIEKSTVDLILFLASLGVYSKQDGDITYEDVEYYSHRRVRFMRTEEGNND